MTAKSYEIRVRGVLNALDLDQIDGLTVNTLGESNYLLTGSLPDPPALYGVLDRIREAQLVLISVHCLSPEQEKE